MNSNIALPYQFENNNKKQQLVAVLRTGVHQYSCCCDCRFITALRNYIHFISFILYGNGNFSFLHFKHIYKAVKRAFSIYVIH